MRFLNFWQKHPPPQKLFKFKFICLFLTKHLPPPPLHVKSPYVLSGKTTFHLTRASEGALFNIAKIHKKSHKYQKLYSTLHGIVHVPE